MTSLSLFTFMHWRRKWQPIPVLLRGESQGRGAWWAAVSGVAQSRTRLKRRSSSMVIFWRRQLQPTPVLLPGKSHGRRSLVGYSPWDHEELDMTEPLHFHFSLSYTGEENGNPLQCSCLMGEPGGLPSMGLHRVGHD